MSGVFDLDEEGARALDEQARLNPLDPASIVPAWQGAGQAAKGLLAPSAAAGRAIALAGAVEPIGWDFAISTVTGQRSTRLQEAYFRDVVDDTAGAAVDYWKPDASAMGSAAKALNVGANVVGSIPQMIGMPGLFLGGQALDPATEVIRQGGSTGTALGVGAVNLAANAAGMKIPASFGTSLATRIATGAGSNLVLGTAADAGTSAILQAGGMKDMAAGFDWSDPYARGLDVLMGVAFGYKGNLDARPTLPAAQRDAILTANNNDFVHRRSMPGEPMDAAAARDHATALNQAQAQLLAGEPVNVTGADGAFALSPEAGRAPDLSSYESMLVALESGGRADARAPGSTATGLHQFTEGTWLATVRNAAPAWADGLTRSEILAERIDPAKSAQMERTLRAENAQVLGDAGVPADAFNLYAAHHFGAKRAVRFAKAEGDAPMESILTAEQLDANPYLKGKTKAEALANWTNRARRAGVEVESLAGVEEGAGIPPDLLEDITPARTAAEAGQLIDDRMALLENLSSTDRMSRDQVEALRGEDADLRSQMLVQEQRDAAGIIPADPRARITADQLQTMTARRAEIRQQIERHNTAMGYENQLRDLRQRLDRVTTDPELMAVAERIRPTERRRAVRIEEPAQRGRGPEIVGEEAPTLKKARAAASNDVEKTEQQGAAPVSETPGLASSPNRESSAEPAAARPPGPLDDLQRLHDAAPTAMALEGFDADGAPRYLSVADALAEITAQRGQAEREATAYTAAASCFLRMGA